jgi:predicted DNA-binding protein YlxM (UPF0122 family)
MIAIAIKSFKFYLLSLLTSMANPLVLRLKRAVKQPALFYKTYLNSLDVTIALSYSKGRSAAEIAEHYKLSKRTIYRRISKVKISTGCYRKEQLYNHLQKWVII